MSNTYLRILRGANTSLLSDPNPVNKRRQLVLLSALIEYPGVGLILYETGCAEDIEVVCPRSRSKSGLLLDACY